MRSYFLRNVSLRTCWSGRDWAKKEVSAFFRKMGREKAKKKREEEERLVNRLHFLFKCKKMGVEVDEEIKAVREQRNDDKKEKGIVFRAKVEEMEGGRPV